MQDRNLTEGLEISSALSSGSYRKVKYKRMRVSRSGMLIVHNSSACQGSFYTSPVQVSDLVRNTIVLRVATTNHSLALTVECTGKREAQWALASP